MDNQRIDKLLAVLTEIRNKIDEDAKTKHQIDKYHQIIQKLGSSASNCEECAQYFSDLENHILQLIDRLEHHEKYDFNQNKQKLDTISKHLIKRHKFIYSGFYLSIFMSIGTSLGVVYGMLIFDNIALGIPIGVGIGVAIGAGLDADAKKKGKTI
jgi:DNA repair exonuclease SbcCD ATPase subunit